MNVSTQLGQFSLIDPKPQNVDWLVIASSLGKLCRFNGHTKGHYSVAEHSVRLAAAVELSNGSDTEILQALLHDAHEAYTGDVTRPMRDAIKQQCVVSSLAIEVIEHRVAKAIFAKANCPMEMGQLLVRLDDEFSEYERILFVNPNTFHKLEDFSEETIEAFDNEQMWERDVASERWLGKLLELIAPPCG